MKKQDKKVEKVVDWKEKYRSSSTGISENREVIRRMKLVLGKNIIRLASKDFEKAWVHYFEGVRSDGNIGIRKVVCLGKAGCPLCKKEKSAKCEWYFNVIDRIEQKENKGKFEVKLLTVGKTIFEQIRELAIDDEYGNPELYNLKITRKGKGKFDTKYSVVASTKKYSLKEVELSVVNKESKDGGAYKLEDFIQKNTKAEILEMLGEVEKEEEIEDEDEEEIEDEDGEEPKKKKSKKIDDKENEDEFSIDELDEDMDEDF